MNPNDNDLSDIWDLSPNITNNNSHPATAHTISNNHTTDSSDIASTDPSVTHQIQNEPSDLPSLRREHINAGYREGLSTGKARTIQSGFDAGYPLGVAIALRVGPILGVLEGLVAALRQRAAESDRGSKSRSESGNKNGGVVVLGVQRKATGPRYRRKPRDDARSKGRMETGKDLEDATIPERRDSITGNSETKADAELAESSERPGKGREGEDGYQKHLEAQTQVMEALLAKARTELSITALLDGLQEEALASAETVRDLGKIDEVIRRWDEMIMIHAYWCLPEGRWEEDIVEVSASTAVS
jgi:hypothetical protein